tara:strand:+ start:473 stop:583 length:111 start_codon:yes stop_codon:yes gene_type:complete
VVLLESRAWKKIKDGLRLIERSGIIFYGKKKDLGPN